MPNNIPSSVYVIKMGYWCNVKGIYNAELEAKANRLAFDLEKLNCVNSAVWNEMQSPVFEIDLNVGEVQGVEDLVYFDRRFRKIITDGGMKIEE